MAEKTVEQLRREFEELSDISRQMEKDFRQTKADAESMVDSVLSFGDRLLGSSGEANELAAEQLETKKDILEIEKQTNLAKMEALKAQIEYLEKQGLSSDEQEKQLKKLRERNAELDSGKKKIDEQTASLKAQHRVYEASSDAFGSIAVRLGISKSESAGLVKNMYSSWRLAVEQDGFWKGTFKTIVSIGKALWDAFNPVSMISSAMNAIFKASVEFLWRSSEAISNFSAAAGDAGAMARDVGAAMSLGTGVNIEQASQAASGLAASWQDFASASREARVSMIRTTAELGRLGIGAEQVGGSISLLTKGMGMSIEQAEDMMKGMASAAMTLGTTPAKLASDFASASASLALYGGRMEEEFYDLAAAAKASGLEIQELLSLGEAFDSFEEGSAKAGQLNALLGGPFVDSLELMRLQAEEGPDAVAGALKDAFESAGKTFEDMSYMERKAYAQTLGLSADKFAKLMGYESDEAKAAAKAAKRDADTQKRYQSMLRSTLSLGEQIRNFFQSVFANPKVMGAIRRLMGVLIGPESQKGMKEITKALGDKMAAAIEVVTIVAERLVDWFGKLVGGWGDMGDMTDENGNLMEEWKIKVEEVLDSVGPYFTGLIEWIKDLVTATKESGSFWSSLWEKMGLTFGNFWDSIGKYMLVGYLAFKGIGALFAWLGAKVMTTFAMGFRKSSVSIGKGFITLARAIARSIKIIGKAFMSPTGMFFTGSLAIILGTLGYSLKQLAAAFQGFGEMMTGIGKAFDAIGGFITHLIKITTDGLSVRMLKFMYDFSKALDVMGMSMRAIPGVQSNYIVQLIKAFQANGPGAASAMDKFAASIERLVAALQLLSTSKLRAFGWNMSQTFEATAKVTPESARGAVEVIEKAKEYQQEVARNKDNVDALAEILKATGAAQPAGAGGQTVIRLELGGTVLDQYIWDSVNSTLNKNTSR